MYSWPGLCTQSMNLVVDTGTGEKIIKFLGSKYFRLLIYCWQCGIFVFKPSRGHTGYINQHF